ncbi:MAG: hypothetical protein V1766_15350 [Pseudomonadota bacterium]
MYYADYAKDNIRIMRSVIYDALDRKLVLSQAQPTVLASSLKKEIIVTYLTREQGKTARFGFSAIIVDFMDHYELASKERVPAIVIERTGAQERFNIRLNFRLKVPFRSSLMLTMGNEALNLIDISVGGGKFSCTNAVSLIPHSRIKLTVSFDGQRHNLEAEVLRVWSPENQHTHNDLQFATVKFLHAGNEVEYFLGKEIFRIERQLLAECKEPA